MARDILVTASRFDAFKKEVTTFYCCESKDIKIETSGNIIYFERQLSAKWELKNGKYYLYFETDADILRGPW